MKKIDKIIGKYYLGESTQEEENILREFLIQNDIPKKYEIIQMQFSYFNEASNETSRLDLDNIEFGEQKKKKINNLSEMQRFAIRISGAAATLIIMISAYFLLVVENDKYPNDTIKDPKIAYIEVNSALSLIAQKMHDGTKKLDKFSVINKNMQKINKLSLFNKNLQKANKLSKFNEYTNKYLSKTIGV